LRYLFSGTVPSAVQNVAVPLLFGWGSASGVSVLCQALAVPIVGSVLVAVLGVAWLGRRDVP